VASRERRGAREDRGLAERERAPQEERGDERGEHERRHPVARREGSFQHRALDAAVQVSPCLQARARVLERARYALRFVPALLSHAARSGRSLIPAPAARSRSNESMVHAGGHSSSSTRRTRSASSRGENGFWRKALPSSSPAETSDESA